MFTPTKQQHTTTMEASLKRRFQYMHPDHLIPLAVRPPPPPSSPDLLPKLRLDDFPPATMTQPLQHDHHHHHHHVYAGGQLIMNPNQYPNLLQATTSSSHHHHFDSSSILIHPNPGLFSSTSTSFNVPLLHGESSTPPPTASLLPDPSTPHVSPPVFASRCWAAPAPVLAFPYLLPAGHVVGGGGGTATTSLPPLVELYNQKEQVGAPDDRAKARKAVNEKNLQRRRRIREKFSSLEKLVPATRRRLNKAAMLEEACKYIKFLEAQVKALASMRRQAAGPAFGGGLRGSFVAAAVPRVLEELSQEQVLEMMVNSEKTQAVLSEKGWCVVSLEQAEVLKSALQSLLLKQKLMAPAQTTQHLHLGHHQPH